jgi:hypothetical protein
MAETPLGTRKRIVPPMRATEKEKKMAIQTTFAYVLNGDTIEVDGLPSLIDEIVYRNEPLMTVWVTTDQFGRTFVLTTDDEPVTILKRGD